MNTKLTPRDIEQLIGRGKQFLRDVSTTPELKHRLAERGYGQREHTLGWNLYLEMAGHVAASAWSATTDDALQGAAKAFESWLDVWHQAAGSGIGREEPSSLCGLRHDCADVKSFVDAGEADTPVATLRTA